MLTQRRGKNVAIGGAVLQLAFTIVMLVIWLQTHSLAAMGCTWLLAGGVPLWLLVAVLFYCRQLQQREATELEDLAADGGSTTIFQQPGQAEIRPAAARTAFLERWIVPIFSLLWAAYHAALGAIVLRHLAGREPVQMAYLAPGTVFTVLAWFMAFLFSYYCLGMSRRLEWRPLRASGSYLLVNSLAVAAVAVCLLAAIQSYARLDRVVAFVLPLVQLVLAAELLLNLLLDVYRPRVPGEESRLSFDSRLFNLVAQPGRVGHSIAEAVNYQFGFEASRTWFYRLVSRAFVPLVLFGAAVLLAASSVVIVREGRQAVVVRWGRFDASRGTLGPGVHLKWPWPVETARDYRVDQVHEISLGVGEEREPTVVRGRELQLWTQEHGMREERNFLIAVLPRELSGPAEQQAPPVSVIKLVVLIHYVIDDVKKYAFGYVNPEKLLEATAYREMVQFCAAATLDEKLPSDSSAQRPEALMTFGRARAAEALRQRLEKVIGPQGLDLGVRLTYLGIETAHPPALAAPAFEEVLQAERRRDGQIHDAEGEANQLLGKVAGTPETALELAFAIRRLGELEKLQELKGRPQPSQQVVADYIARIQSDLKVVGQEIDQERLLGQLREDRRTPRQELERRFSLHLQALQKIRDGDPSYDVARGIQEAAGRVEELFDRASGEPAVLVARAQADRWKLDLGERARMLGIQSQAEAYRGGGVLYLLDRWLTTMEEVLPPLRKYVLTVDRDKIEIRLGLEEKSAGLGEVFLPQQAGEKK